MAGVLKTAVRPRITVCPVSFISSYSPKYSSILPKLIQSLRCLSQPSPRPSDKTACRKWLWGDCLSRAAEQGNKAASVIKIRAVFTGSDRHQTPTLDGERAGWGGKGGRKSRQREAWLISGPMPVGTAERRGENGVRPRWGGGWGGVNGGDDYGWKFGKRVRGRGSGWAWLRGHADRLCTDWMKTQDRIYTVTLDLQSNQMASVTIT